MTRFVNLDHQAGTPVSASVFEAMRPFFFEEFGNPSSLHRSGLHARDALELARLQNLILGLQSKQRQPGLSAQEIAHLQERVMELTAMRKECLDRTKPPPNSFSP